ncbi:D-glycerate dehydrogenase [SAR202 cluster bacterium AD-804-J14_MRT_500m]|nr:D-glycerate dehydrogenase [SAR202 cluster bacterium AD-804-J14_MRT_500m]
MPKPKVFVARQVFQEALDMISVEADMEVWTDEMPPPREVLLEKVSDVDGLLSLLTDKIDGELMDAAPNLRAISQIAVGYENIDIAEATSRGIPVGYTPGVLTGTTADMAFALLMAAARKLVPGADAVRSGKWRTWHPLHFLGHDIFGSTLGILGMGRIGLEMAKRAKGFDMPILYNDVVRRSEEEEKQFNMTFANLDTVLQNSDFISVHVNLTPETYHLIGERALGLMKTTAVLVNAARGPVVDPKALYRALSANDIAAAALDVTEPEPISANDPLVGLENCLIVPHIASASVATRLKMSTLAAENLICALKGQPMPNCVNPEVYQK